MEEEEPLKSYLPQEVGQEVEQEVAPLLIVKAFKSNRPNPYHRKEGEYRLRAYLS